MLPHIVLIHYSSYPKHPSGSDYSSKKSETIGLKTWKELLVEVITCLISWSELERVWNMQGWSTKNSHSLEVLLVFARGVTCFCGMVLATNFDFPRITKTNLETLMEFLQRHFLRYPACVFFSGTDHWWTDRTSFLGVDLPCVLELFLNLPEIKSVTDYI